MATVTEKKPQRYRIQLSMSRSLHENYRACMATAEKLKLEIDFNREFERWFAAQVDDAMRKIETIKEQNEVSSDHEETPSPSPRRKLQSSSMVNALLSLKKEEIPSPLATATVEKTSCIDDLLNLGLMPLDSEEDYGNDY